MPIWGINRGKSVDKTIGTPPVEDSEEHVVNSSGESDSILVLDVRASRDRVIALKRNGDVYLRQNDSSVRLDREQVRALEYDKNQRRFEDEVADRSGIDDVDTELLARYKAEIGTDVSDEQALRSRGLLVDGHLESESTPISFTPLRRHRVAVLLGPVGPLDLLGAEVPQRRVRPDPVVEAL